MPVPLPVNVTVDGNSGGDGQLAESSVAAFTETESLYSGSSLEIDEAGEISRRSRAILVTVVGMIESGKTSLIARIHQQFQSGPLGDYCFAGSRTLLRLEEMSWLATVESGVGRPSMEHTSRRYDNSCLHLTVQGAIPENRHTDLLLNDVSGDTYPDAIAASSVCETLLCLQRADHLVVVVDGAAMVDRNRRHDHYAKALEFVQRAIQTGQIGPWTVLHLIFTKLDTFKSEPETSPAKKAVSSLEAEFKAKFDGRVAQIHCWRIAARPLDGSLPTTETIAQIFEMWMGLTCRYMVRPDLTPLPHSRDFSYFGHGDGSENAE